MNIRDLRYLVAVADYRHFSKAAEASAVSQPTLSMQLKKLEESLGVQLFERSKKQVMVTPIGMDMVERARRILQGVDEMTKAAIGAKDLYAGEFRLGAFPTLAPYYLPQAVARIRKIFPKLRILLVEEKTAELVELLKKGALDAALLALPVVVDALEFSTLFDDVFYLAVPRGHSLSKLKQVRQQDLKNEALLLLEDGHCLRKQALDVCSLLGIAEKQDFRATSMETLRQMVAAGIGVTLIPEMARRKDDSITYIPFAKPEPKRTIGLFWRKTNPRIEIIREIGNSLTKQ